MTLVDTHVLIWLDRGDPRLGTTCRQTLEQALSDEALYISAISFWETAMLVTKGRLAFDVELDTWRRDLIAAGFQELPVDGFTGIRAATLTGLHRDPADRILAATALVHGCALATADNRLLTWQADLPRLNATE